MNKQNAQTSDAFYASLTDEEAQLLLEAYNRLIFWWGYAGETAQLALRIERLIQIGLLQELTYNVWGITDIGTLWLEANGYTDDLDSKLLIDLLFLAEGDAPPMLGYDDGWKLFPDCLDDDDFDGALPIGVRS